MRRIAIRLAVQRDLLGPFSRAAPCISAAYEAVDRLLHPQDVARLGAIVAASIVGFVGNEGVAIFRIRVGKEIGSAALIADGYPARTDGWTSLAVLFGALGVRLGYPMADPIIGMVITVAILGVVWSSATEVVVRALDGVEPELLEQVRKVTGAVAGVVEVREVRARWIGHRLRAEVTVEASASLTSGAGTELTSRIEHALKHEIGVLSGVGVQVAAAE